MARNEGLLSPEGQWREGVHACVVDINQNPCFVRKLTVNRFITLLRKSRLYDLVADRLLTPEEHLLSSGYPVPGLVDKQSATKFPYRSLLPTLTERQLLSLSGNGLHLCAVGCFLYHAFGLVPLPEEKVMHQTMLPVSSERLTGVALVM